MLQKTAPQDFDQRYAPSSTIRRTRQTMFKALDSMCSDLSATSHALPHLDPITALYECCDLEMQDQESFHRENLCQTDWEYRHGYINEYEAHEESDFPAKRLKVLDRWALFAYL